MGYSIPTSRFSRGERSERGYVLLVLLLFVAVLSIGFLAMVRKIDFQIKRDREEELIHRGVQYSRAVKRYFKKFGRYPTRIEDLESTNNMRFLRKRYKDPITGKDFKLLHLTDLAQTAGVNSALMNVAATGLNGMQSAFRGGGNFASGSNFGAGGNFGGGGGGARFGPGPMSSSSMQQPGAPGALSGMMAAPVGPGPSSIVGPDNSSSGQQGDASAGNQSNPAGSGTGPNPQPLSQRLGANGAPQVFGGGAIIGVASVSKDKTIREFNKKDHYDQWQFVYDPTLDRGGLLMTPNQPPLQGAVPVNQMQSQPNNGQPGFAAPGQGFGVNQPAPPPASQPPVQQ